MTWQRILDTELKAICICWEGGGAAEGGREATSTLSSR